MASDTLSFGEITRLLDPIFRSSNRKRYHPSDWTVKHTIRVKPSDDIVDWLEENTKGWWEFEDCKTEYHVYFTRDVDAMAFKLRWL